MPLDHRINFLNYSLKREVTEIYLSLAIKRFGLALIVLFEPVYLYLYFDRSISKVLLFFAIVYGGFGLFAPLGGKIMGRLGLKRTMLLSTPFLFLYYLLLNFLHFSPWLLVPIILSDIIYKILFWPAFHTNFVRFSRHSMRGSMVSKMNIIGIIFNALGPVVGGLVIAYFGYPPLFLLVLIILVLSALPLFFSGEVFETYSLSFRETFKWIFRWKNWRYLLSLAGYGAESVVYVFIWPIFMFLIVSQYSVMGVITTAVLVFGLLVAFYVGRLTDKIGRRRVLRLGTILYALSWLVKIFTRNGFQIFFTDSYQKIAEPAAYIPYETIIYDKAGGYGEFRDEFIVFREVAINSGRVIAFVGLAILFLFTSQLQLSFILAALSSLILMLV